MVRLSIRNGLAAIIIEPSMLDTAASQACVSFARGLVIDVDDSEFSSSEVFKAASPPSPLELHGEKLPFVARVDGVAPHDVARHGARRFRPLHERWDAAGELTSGDVHKTVFKPRG